MSNHSVNVNGKTAVVDVDPATPLLWVIREHLQLTGTKFGCGIAQCGACTVHVDGEAARSCVTPLPRSPARSDHHRRPVAEGSHPLQKAWVAERVPQCGYCQSG